VVVVALVVAAALVRHWALTYEPLTEGSLSVQPPGSVVTAQDRVLHLRWAPGSEQHVIVSVRNGGHRSIRIDGTTYARPEGSPLWLTTTRWGRQSLTSTDTVFHVFPVTVKPGSEVLIQLTFSQPRCGWPPSSGAGYPPLQVRTRALGRAHDWTVSTGFAMVSATAPKAVPAPLAAPCQAG
jgi:hypothetical protein